MSEYELQRKEAIGVSETLRFIEAARSLLPQAKPQIIDLREMFDDEEAINVVVGAHAEFKIGDKDITVEEAHPSSFPEISVTVTSVDTTGEHSKKTIDLYTVYLDDLDTSFATLESDFNPTVPIRMLQVEDVPDLVKDISIMMQVSEIVGDNVLSHERFTTVMRLLSECGPDNLTDFSS